jgi:hypothetical protein
VKPDSSITNVKPDSSITYVKPDNTMKPNIKVTHAEPVCRRNRSRKGANVQTDDKIMNIRKPSSERNNKKTYKPKNKTQRQSESRELHKNRLCYICQFCGQTFDQICHLKRHYQCQHLVSH